MNNIKDTIKWADKSWNIVSGCLNTCEYCYARRIAKRFQGNSGFKPKFHPERFEQLAKQRKPAKVFVCSMSDLFGDWIPKEWIQKTLDEIAKYPQHTFMFLTKNPKRYAEFKFSSNCWLGTTITCQKDLDRVTLYPMNKQFFSIEPILELVDLKDMWVELVIVGAETGNRKGKIIPQKEWIQKIIDYCKQKEIEVFLKDSVKKLRA